MYPPALISGVALLCCRRLGGGHLEVVIKLAEMGVDPAAVERVSSFCFSLSARNTNTHLIPMCMNSLIVDA